MKTVWWVVGGSAAGKRKLIGAIMQDAAVRRALGMLGTVEAPWLHGVPTPTRWRECGADHLLLRWQWDRSEWIEAAMAAGTENHRILLVACPASERSRRAARRSPSDQWPAENLAREFADMLAWVAKLVECFNPPLVWVRSGHEREDLRLCASTE